MWHTIKNGQTWHGDICNRAKDGSLYWVDTTIVPFMNRLNQPVQYVAIRRDIFRKKTSSVSIRIIY